MFVTNPNVKGNVAELAIAMAAARLGVPVFAPLTEHSRCDLAIDVGGRLWRIQCKWGRLSPAKDVVIVRTSGSRYTTRGYVMARYWQGEVDFFGVYCGELDRSFLIPAEVAEAKYQVYLRLHPTRNGQQACTNLADDYDFPGAVAQLGERRAGSAKVRGSSPLSSTTPFEDGAPRTSLGVNRFRDQLGYWMDRAAAGTDLTITRRGKPLVRVSPA